MARIPTSLVLLPWNVRAVYTDNSHYQEVYDSAELSISTVKDNSYFIEEKVDGGHNVVHVKQNGMRLGPLNAGYRSGYVLVGNYPYNGYRPYETYKLNSHYFGGAFSGYPSSPHWTGSAAWNQDMSPRTLNQFGLRMYVVKNAKAEFTNNRTYMEYDYVEANVQLRNAGDGLGWKIYSSSGDELLCARIMVACHHLIPDETHYRQADKIPDSLFDSLYQAMSTISFDLLTWTRVKNNAKGKYIATPEKPSSGSFEDVLVFDEVSLLINKQVSQKPYAAYHLKAARQAAYLDALDHVPQLNDNMVSNVIEFVSFMKHLIIDHRVEIPDSLSSTWLAYRYSYGTTKMDVQEAISFVDRHVDKEFLTKGFSCYGTTHYQVGDVDALVKCRLDMRQKELSYLDEIWSNLYRYGLSPSFYVFWDMIPYSFIVDWFIPVGDILKGYDTTLMYDRTYDISNIWYSIQYFNTVDDTKYHSYTRWHEDASPEYQGYYTLENKGTPSNKVIGFRVLDALSLIFC